MDRVEKVTWTCTLKLETSSTCTRQLLPALSSDLSHHERIFKRKCMDHRGDEHRMRPKVGESKRTDLWSVDRHLIIQRTFQRGDPDLRIWCPDHGTPLHTGDLKGTRLGNLGDGAVKETFFFLLPSWFLSWSPVKLNWQRQINKRKQFIDVDSAHLMGETSWWPSPRGG